MGFKMAASDRSTKVVLGVLALAGVAVALFFLSKRLRKKKKTNESASSLRESDAQDAPLSAKGRQNSPDRNENSGFTPKQSSDAYQSGDTLPKILQEKHSDYDKGTQEMEAVLSAISTKDEDNNRDYKNDPDSEIAPISSSLASWENIKSMTESFASEKSPFDIYCEMQKAAGDLSISQIGQDSLESYMELSMKEDSFKSRQENVLGKSDRGDGLLATDAGSSILHESMVTDDIQSLQSEEVSSGDGPSFEHINNGDEANSLIKFIGVEGTENPHNICFQPQLIPQQNSEIVDTESARLKTNEITDTPSFEQIIDSNGNQSLNLIKVSNDDSIKPVEEETKREIFKAYSQAEDRLQTELAELERNEKSQIKKSSSDGEDSEITRKSLGGQREEFYSTESLQSFATAFSDGSKQDFYSPISSPSTVNSSLDNISFESFEDAEDGEAETSEELTYYDPDASGRITPPTPQDRTPTNTPVLQEPNVEDTESAVTPSDEMSSFLEANMIVDEVSKDSAVNIQDDSSEQQADQSKHADTRNDYSSRPALTIDKDKIAEAIQQAQSSPDRLEIGHLQILVELLKQDDWTLLNTTLQCIIRATAFTINVNILTVCEGPKELTRLLEKFAPLLVSGAQPASEGQAEGAPSVESLFLGIARAINNLAMDIKSQAQLQGSIPVLTDLLMTEGISESVTLASLQPLTNLSATNSKTYLGHYTRLLQQLYSFLDTSQSASLRLQCLKLLVNLSLNADMVPHMLAAKAPSCLLDLLDINYDVELLLRMVTFLANIIAIMQERNLSPSDLPPDEKAPSPETLYSALFALEHRDALRNKVYRLTRHDSEDVCYQASRLYKYVSSSK